MKKMNKSKSVARHLLLILLLVAQNACATIQSILVFKKGDKTITLIGDLGTFCVSYHLSETEFFSKSTGISVDDKEDKSVFIRWLKYITESNYRFKFYILTNQEGLDHDRKLAARFGKKNYYVPLAYEVLASSQKFCKLDPQFNFKFVLADLRCGALFRFREFLGRILLFGGKSNIYLKFYSKLMCDETLQNFIDRYRCVERQVGELVAKLPVEESLAVYLALELVKENFEKQVLVLKDKFKAYKLNEPYVSLFSTLSNTKEGPAFIKSLYEELLDDRLAHLGLIAQVLNDINEVANNSIIFADASLVLSDTRLLQLLGYELVYKAGFYREKGSNEPIAAYKFTPEELNNAFNDVTRVISGGNVVEPKAAGPDESRDEDCKQESKCANSDCKKEGTMQCARCKNVRYCSAACQKAHWKQHKKDCAKK